MKKSILAFAILTCSFVSYSQTTQEEYNYLTKDYPTHRNDKGFEIKKGYEMQNLFFNDADSVSITMQKFVKVDGDKKTAVAYVLGYKKGKNATEFICIPHPNTSVSEVNSAFWKSLGTSNSSEKYQFVVSTLARQLTW